MLAGIYLVFLKIKESGIFLSSESRGSLHIPLKWFCISILSWKTARKTGQGHEGIVMIDKI
jgi:hypothetical protein